MDTHRPLAVITGASSGIGLELARVCAGHGYDLLVTAEDGGLALAAEELREQGTDVTAVRADLALYDGVETLCRAISGTGRPVSALALNAGVGSGGAFLDTDLSDDARVIDLNVTATVHLAKRLLPEMVARGSGRVLITSSIASTMPGPYQAVYNASKSFLQSFSQALADELKGTGVTVTSLMPGATATDFFRRAHMLDTRVGRAKKDNPALVAEQGFRAMTEGRQKIVAGSVKTKLQGAVANRVLPDRVKALMHHRMAEPGGGR
ncbi:MULTISPECIES: SDR family NAD(P)-dependent oxidoreductase [unclassified Streptomyces]|uniref:SDR family NAD(P)-dependent oxidoreductase n=1 Tax=unclassified Streptomyces TaxID=2593676 RepID=UPI002E3433CE|nr:MULTISPECIES: SDR family NAD(P)-dependent oxidoreductase [unclassified Streptomyces]WUC63292.1 SDR family NAD(P)-dependent oxidoreductase [Streptomyces sp. NBC_00539]